MSIHPTALVSPKAKIDPSVEVGPYAIIEDEVTIARGTKIGAHVFISKWTMIGEACTFYPFSSIGMPPQDLKYKGEETWLRMGDRNTFREYVTLHRGTVQGQGETVLGDDNFLMAYVHVAHDCRVGNRVILANAATLGGHVVVGDHTILGGLVGVHQFVQIGPYALAGGGAILTQDVPPYARVAGNRATLHGINLIGLKRHQFGEETVRAIQGAYKTFFRSALVVSEAAKIVREKWGHLPEIEVFVSFIERSKRGVCR